MRGGRAAEVVALLILALGTWLGFATSGLPDLPRLPATASPSPSVFSLQGAMTHLRAITIAPHPVGTAEHDRVRDYLVDQLRASGFDEVHVQSATGFNTLQGPLAATVANVVGRKRGTGGGPALVLSAHYDAVPRSFGAGDDGVAVAAILEALRALANAPPLKRDLIVVFNDAEENGLLGAEAFVNLHPWAKDAGVVLNFDGRGTDGPVYMFQTSPGNDPLIDALAQVNGARTNSLTGEVYRHLPSDTDLSVWLHSGLPVGALNFAHVGGYTRYHTPMDNITAVDQRIVQQMGEYALTLTRTLGSGDLTAMRTTDAIYFSAPFVGVIRYPGNWAVIVAVDALVLVLVLIGMGWYRRTITLGGVGRGALALLITLALPTLTTIAVWRLIAAVHPGYREILQRDPYNSLWYLLAAGAFTVAVAVAVQRRFTARNQAMEIALVPMLVWGIIGLIVAIVLPGASYLFVWPLFAATMCGSWWRRETLKQRTPPAALALFALPALILWPPLLKSLNVALTVSMLPFCVLLLALVLSLLTMQLHLAGELRRWIVRGAAIVAVVALIRAETSAGFDAAHRRPNSISYLADTDSSKAWWASFDRQSDSWTRQVLGDDPERRTFPSFGLAGLLAAPAPQPASAPSPLHLLSSEPKASGRRVHLHIDRSGPGEHLTLLADSTTVVTQMIINGRELVDGRNDRYLPQYHVGAGGRVLRYFGVPAEGVDLWFTVAGTAPITLRVISSVEGLPAMASGALTARPADMTSKPFVATDVTLTLRRIQL